MIKMLFALTLIEIESEQESDSFLSFPRQPGILLTFISSKQEFIIVSEIRNLICLHNSRDQNLPGCLHRLLTC